MVLTIVGRLRADGGEGVQQRIEELVADRADCNFKMRTLAKSIVYINRAHVAEYKLPRWAEGRLQVLELALRKCSLLLFSSRKKLIEKDHVIAR